MRTLYLACLLSISTFLTAQPEIELTALKEFFAQPVDVVSAHDGSDELYIVEKGGKAYRYDLSEGTKELFLDLSAVVNTRSEGGFLGMAFHPKFPDSSYFYVNYTVSSARQGVALVTRIRRFTVTPDGMVDERSEKMLLDIDQPADNHNAGDLAFGPDGYLYVPTGDGGGGGDPFRTGQNPKSLLAKLLRIDVDRQEDGKNYAIPADNPYVNSADTLPEIWSQGLRNPWRISFDRETGDLWIGDVGQGAREEVNFQPAGNKGGQNYGWSCREGSIAFNGPGPCTSQVIPFHDPVLDYPRSGNGGINGASITGGFVYRGPSESLRGYYIFADFARPRVFFYGPDLPEADRLTVRSDLGLNSITSFGEDNQGRLYAATIGGGIYEITGRETTPVTFPVATEELYVFPNPARDRLTIQLPERGSRVVSVNLFTLDGKKVFERKLAVNSAGVVIAELPDLISGVYTLEVANISHRLVIYNP